MTAASTKRLYLERDYDCTPEQMWAAWTDPAQFAKWFNPWHGLDVEVHEWDARPGGRVSFTMACTDGSRFREQAVFERLDRPRELVLDMRNPEREAAPDLRLTVRIAPVSGRTRLTVEQTGYPKDFNLDNARDGWRIGLDKLATLVHTNEPHPQTRQEGTPMSANQTPAKQLRLERTFNCTPEQMWAAWTDPKQYAKWLNPSTGLDLVIHEWDLREGGLVRFDMPLPNGQINKEEGVFHVLKPYTKIVSGAADKSFVLDATFEPVGATRTRLLVEITGVPPEWHEAATQGWGACFDKLTGVLAGHENEREGSQTLRFERTYSCTPEQMWAAWTDPKQVAKWISPMPGMDAEIHELVARPGGRIRFTMVDTQGNRFPEEVGVYEVVDRPHTLVQYSSNAGRDDIFAGYPQRMKARFEPDGNKTRLVFEVTGLPPTFPLEMARGGFGACLEKLQVHLIGEQVRATGADVNASANGFTIERVFKAAPEAVWRMWTTPEGVMAWWAESARDMGFDFTVNEMDVRVGGKFGFAMVNKDNNLLNHGTYTTVRPHTDLAWTWHFDIFLAPGEKAYDVPIEVRLERTATGGTRMTFKQGPLAKPEFTEGSRQGVLANFEKMAKALGE